MILNDCACPLSLLNFIGSTYPCHFDGQVRSRHAFRCPKAIHGSAALCSGLQGDVSDMILVVKLLRYIIICHHMPIITSEDKPQHYMAYHKQ